MKKFLIVAVVILGLAAVPAFAGDLQAGTPAPDFTLPSQSNTPISLSQYRGKWVVLYFYPKDMTPGCTLEAHNFQRDLSKFSAVNAVVLGVSLDTPQSHATFCSKESLTFKLLADPKHKVVDEYGVPVRHFGIMNIAVRQTFLIDPQGKIVKVWPDVDKDIKDHSTQVLAAIRDGGK